MAGRPAGMREIGSRMTQHTRARTCVSAVAGADACTDMSVIAHTHADASISLGAGNGADTSVLLRTRAGASAGTGPVASEPPANAGVSSVTTTSALTMSIAISDTGLIGPRPISPGPWPLAVGPLLAARRRSMPVTISIASAGAGSNHAPTGASASMGFALDVR